MKIEALEEMLEGALDKELEDVLDTERKSHGDDPDPNDDDYTPSITKYLKGATGKGWEKADKEHELYEEANKYSSDVGSEGGIFIHPQIQEQIVPLIRNQSVVRQLGPQVVNLPNTNTLQLQRQTQASEAFWIGEGEDVEAKNGQEVRWGDLELTLRTVAGFSSIPNTLLEDAAEAADRLIRNDMAKVIALKEDLGYLEGTGGKEPLGIRNRTEIPGKDLGEKLDNSGNGFDDLIDMQTAIQKNNGNATSWLMNPTMRGYIRKITDNNDNNIWQPGGPSGGDQSEDSPDMLLGLPVYYSNQVPVADDGNGSTYIVLADWSEFLIAQKRDGISMDASDVAGDAFEKNLTKYRAIRRVTGGPRVPENFYILDDIYTS